MTGEAVFLSASIPDPRRNPQYAETADPFAIGAAVAGLVHVTLGRRLLVWGGHPAITPMVWAVAEGVGVEYGSWVKLYQSRFFEGMFPQENARFQNVTYVDAVNDGRDESLAYMRQRMLEEQKFFAAVFVGGMEGVEAECELFRGLQPAASAYAVATTGGAAWRLHGELYDQPACLANSIDYIGMFHRLLGIAANETRHPRRS
ncbi:MAG: hypothetical protein GKR94_23610 [Gammaproteobacteria bacterium]|nr:hypothetical protein [Gammaproteobacteria bacterium]